MLLQCAADFHGKRERYEKFVKVFEERQPDIVIIAGDWGSVEKKLLEKIDVPIYGVYGNMDGSLSYLNDLVRFIDGEIVEHESVVLLGIGSKYPGNVERQIDIIVSHIPPYKTKDRAFFGMHIGNKWLRHLMEEKEPRYIICGHVHEDAGYERYGKSYVVNCSVGKKGTATIIDTESNEIEMIGY